ncbi:MAG TPA: ferrous iron transport protein B [Candidatus Binatia bacterium]|nr:ferrous iron transport protein B [Candidatus Binatia bacterium]
MNPLLQIVASSTTRSQQQIRNVALIGPPNSGKTTLFNRLTNLRQKVGNYPGITVEQHTGVMALPGQEITIVDLPGVYGLNPYSEDERVAVNVLNGNMDGVPRPEAVLLVLDATNLTRHLSLAAPVIALGLPTLALLNMGDLLTRRSGSIDAVKLAGDLGIPVAIVSATMGTGLEAVGRFLECANSPIKTTLPIVQDVRECRKWAARVASESDYRPPLPPTWSRRLDDILLHNVWGPLVFMIVVGAVFQTVFGLGQPLSNALQDLLTDMGQKAAPFIANGFLRSLLLDGIWKGVTSVLVFLPQILVLFLFIGLLEDSGYLARAALIADRTMSFVGLNGKAFIPLLSAYSCAVPAIMASRTIENKRDRLATILIAPFMTCSARLPIYTLLIAAFIPERPVVGPFLGSRALAMLLLYVLGFVAAIGTAKMLKSSVLKSMPAPFVLELPEYRCPTLRSVGLRLMDRGRVFVQQAGTVILLVSLLVWGLTNLPLHQCQPPELEDSVVAHLGHLIEPAIRPLGFNWKIGVGLLTSVVAREVIVGTLGTLYGRDPQTRSVSLQSALQHDLTFSGAMALLVFFAFAMQCTSTLAVVRRETNSWMWPAIQFFYMTGVAFLAALVVHETLSVLN